MRSLVAKEKCTFCYTYLTECKKRVSCSLINVKQLGGLVYPTFDVVSVIQIANRTFENALKTLKVQQVLRMAVEMMKDIVSEILCDENEFFMEIAAHDPEHKLAILKKIVFSFISMKGKYICNSTNVQQNSLLRNKLTKQILFRHE